MTKKNTTPPICSRRDEHQAHMMLNGECPWCGAYDPDAIDPNCNPEDFG